MAARFLWVVMLLLSSAVALVSCRYLANVGPVPPTIAGNERLNPWIVVHAAGAATALLLGPWQFLARLRQPRPKLHRMIGGLYIAGCVTGGVAGLVLATGVSSGPVAQAGFGTLGVAWLAVVMIGWFQATRRRFLLHQNWMIRSFALTLSAVTLRIYTPASVALHLPMPGAYVAISWLCWVPNLIVAETYLRWSR